MRIPSPTQACPGCGLALPGTDAEPSARTNASAACAARYDELAAFELSRAWLAGRWHQLAVDTYAAQHAGRKAKAISGAFGLIGLCLALERGRSGVEVRAAHQWLARVRREWPVYEPPVAWPQTVADVILTEADFPVTLRAWAEAVWGAWGPAHAEVAGLIDALLPGKLR